MIQGFYGDRYTSRIPVAGLEEIEEIGNTSVS